MQRSDLEGIQRRGRLDRAVGISFGENPFYGTSLPLSTAEQLFEWNDQCIAWASGWLAADAGRDKALQSLLKVPCW